MKESNRRSKLLIIITIATFILVVIGATYAYFQSNFNTDARIELGVTTAKQAAFTSSTNGSITFDVEYSEMSQTNVNMTRLKESSANLTVDLASEDENSVTICDYDIVWIWDSEEKYTLFDEGMPYKTEDEEYLYEFSIQVGDNSEKDLSSLEWQEIEENNKTITKAKLAQKSVRLNKGAGSTSDTTKITARMYNVPVDQKNLLGKNFGAHITVENVMCVSVADVELSYYVNYRKKAKEIEVDSVPRGNYALNEEQTKCEKEGTISNYNSITGELSYDVDVGDKCKIYFDELEAVDATGQSIAKEYDETEKSIIVTSNKITGPTVYYSLNDVITKEDYKEKGSIENPTVQDIDNYRVYWCAEKSGYATYCSSNTITISDAIIEYTSTGYNGEYDEEEHGIDIQVENLEDYTIYYSVSERLTIENYKSKGTTKEPTKKEVGRSQVYYCIESDGYNTICGNNEIVITPETYAPTTSNTNLLVDYIINTVYNSEANKTSIADGGTGIYYHDGNIKIPYGDIQLAAGDAEDNSYRYAGANELVNNFVCFSDNLDEDGQTCKDGDENLFRIIGAFKKDDTTYQVKLIKYTSFPEKMGWWTYQKNTWENSDLDRYLNFDEGSYVSQLGDKAELIDVTLWKVEGILESRITNYKAKGIYDEEVKNNALSTTLDQKIGLMYISDYLYAALPAHWKKVPTSYSTAYQEDWLWASSKGTITRTSDMYKTYSFYVNNLGNLTKGEARDGRFIWPTFNLLPSVKIINAQEEGIGAKTKPIIIDVKED